VTVNYLTCIITHGTLACSIRKAAEHLTHPPSEVYCYSNQEAVLEEIEASIIKLAAEKNPDKIIIFVDMFGGSCWIAANRIKCKVENTSIISGVNIPMLVSYYINYERLDWEALLEKIVLDAKKGIVSR